MRACFQILAAAFVLSFSGALFAQAQPPAQAVIAAGASDGVRLKDLVRIVGVRNNQLLGYGLVVGLPGTGDSRSRLASESVRNLLGSLGARLEGAGRGARNIAAVLVTAEIPPFAKRGDKVDVVVSSIGDARSLEGGVLVQTPLYAGDKQIYAVAQGVITTGGRSQERSDGRRQPKTVGNVLSGAHVERDVDMNYVGADRQLRVSLKRFDFATLSEVGIKIAETLPDAKTRINGGSLLIEVPKDIDTVTFIAKLEEIRIVPKYRARVVINERSGTIVMGGDVKVDPVAISRGGLQIIITGQAEKKDPSQPALYQEGESAQKKKTPATHAFSGASIQEIIQALNNLGASVQDVIAILEALKDSGALHAELVVI